MASFRNDLATNVCKTCKNRKKGCDKKLPRCGYCSKRSLECCYYHSQDWTNPGLRQGNSGLFRTDSSIDVAQISDPGINYLVQTTSAVLHPFSMSSGLGGVLTTGEDLQVQILHNLGATGKSIPQIRDDFFLGVYRWLPIIAPWRLSTAELDFEHKALETDALVLLMAMSLCTRTAPINTKRKTSQTDNSEYLTTKLLFAQAQTILTATLPLLQANVLIAVYEFGGRLPQKAYVTIQTCRGMCELLGIGSPQKHQSCTTGGADSPLRAVEECNVVRGLGIMDRLIMLEAFAQSQKSLTAFSGAYVPLPQFFDQHIHIDPEILTAASLDSAVVSAMNVYLGDGFPRQAQAVAILDQILRQLPSQCSIYDKVRSLRGVDMELQAFLAIAMDKYQAPGHHCGAIAVGIRTLFVLHYSILALRDMNVDSDEIGAVDEAHSWAALDSAARMMSAVAESHMKDIANIDILPLTAAYNAHIAIQHLQSRMKLHDDSVNSKLDALRVMDEAFRQRWMTDEALGCSSETRSA